MIPSNRPFAWGFFFALGAWCAFCLLTLATYLFLVGTGWVPRPQRTVWINAATGEQTTETTIFSKPSEQPPTPRPVTPGQSHR